MRLIRVTQHAWGGEWFQNSSALIHQRNGDSILVPIMHLDPAGIKKREVFGTLVKQTILIFNVLNKGDLGPAKSLIVFSSQGCQEGRFKGRWDHPSWHNQSLFLPYCYGTFRRCVTTHARPAFILLQLCYYSCGILYFVIGGYQIAHSGRHLNLPTWRGGINLVVQIFVC